MYFHLVQNNTMNTNNKYMLFTVQHVYCNTDTVGLNCCNVKASD